MTQLTMRGLLKAETRNDKVTDQQYNEFINTGILRLNRRMTQNEPALSIDTDSNNWTVHQPDVLFYASMREYSRYIKNWEEAVHFDDLTDKELNRLDTTTSLEVWPSSAVPVIRTEEQTAIAVEDINGA